MPPERENTVSAQLSIDGLDADLRLVEARAREGVSQLFELEAVLASRSATVDLSQVIDRAALLTVSGEEGVRHLHGVVAAFEQHQTVGDTTLYRAVVVPRQWRLLHRHDCRIFQNKRTDAIVAEVLRVAGVPAAACRFELNAANSLPAREYCVQYRESDWAFVCRLLEEDGCFFFYEHSERGHVLVIGNHPGAHPVLRGGEAVRFHAPSPEVPPEEHVFALTRREAVCTGTVTLTDYNPLRPSLSMRVQDRAARFADLEQYDFPGDYALPEAGSTLARLRRQEASVQRQQVRGESDVLRMCAGHRLTLTHHPAGEQKLMLTALGFALDKPPDLGPGALGSRFLYSNRFSAMPADVPFRPPRVTPKPTARGVQTAVVVGPAGEEIYTDQHGRVKVQFHWDRLGKMDQHSSCWIRVSQLWASQGWGALWLPRIGDEVIVDFVEGDPDRPIVTGRVYHAQNVPPYALPAEKTKSTIKSNSSPGGGGSNELRFEDRAGAEQVYVHAQRDLDTVVENDETRQVGNNRTTDIGVDDSLTVGNDRTQTVGNNRTTQVGVDDSLTVGSNRKKSVGASETIAVTADRTATVGGSDTLTVTVDRKVDAQGTIVMNAVQSLTLQVGLSSVVISAEGMVRVVAATMVTVDGPLVMLNCGLPL